MRVESSTLLEAAYASWRARDLEAVLACFADDVVFVSHLPTDVVPFAGASYGKAELRQQLQIILDQFDFLEYRPAQIIAKRSLCRSQVYFHYRHKATGLTYEGRLRHVSRATGDRIARFEEFHDPERARAFFELLALYDKQSQFPDRVITSRMRIIDGRSKPDCARLPLDRCCRLRRRHQLARVSTRLAGVRSSSQGCL